MDGRDEPFFGDAIYNTYRENMRAFEDFGVWTPYANIATMTGRSQPEEIRALTLSRGVLTTLRVRPEVGRIFSESDDAPRAPDTVMLSHAYWQREFGGDPSVHRWRCHHQCAPASSRRRDACWIYLRR